MIYQNSEVSVNEWKSFLSENRFASPFQSHEFYNFYNSIPTYSAEVFAIVVESQFIALVLVTIQKEKGFKGFFSRRGIIYGGPLIKDGKNAKKALKMLLEHISDYFKNKIIYCEVRNAFDYGKYVDVFINCGWRINQHLNVQLSLIGKTMENVLAGMKYNRRREIIQSFREGALVREAQSNEEIRILYNIVNNLYKVKVKVPFPDFTFFQNLYKNPLGKVFVVLKNEKIIGGSYCMYYPSSSIYTLYYAGVREYHRKIFPTHLAIIGAINFALKNNLLMIDFMGAGKPNQLYGVRDYKMQFGGELVSHGRFIKVLNPVLLKIGKFGLKVLAKF